MAWTLRLRLVSEQIRYRRPPPLPVVVAAVKRVATVLPSGRMPSPVEGLTGNARLPRPLPDAALGLGHKESKTSPAAARQYGRLRDKVLAAWLPLRSPALAWRLAEPALSPLLRRRVGRRLAPAPRFRLGLTLPSPHRPRAARPHRLPLGPSPSCVGLPKTMLSFSSASFTAAPLPRPFVPLK